MRQSQQLWLIVSGHNFHTYFIDRRRYITANEVENRDCGRTGSQHLLRYWSGHIYVIYHRARSVLCFLNTLIIVQWKTYKQKTYGQKKEITLIPCLFKLFCFVSNILKVCSEGFFKYVIHEIGHFVDISRVTYSKTNQDQKSLWSKCL